MNITPWFSFLTNLRLDLEFFNNSLADYFIFGLWLIGFLTLFYIIQTIVIKKIESLTKNTQTDIDDTLIEVIKTIKPSFYFFVAFYLALKTLIIPAMVQTTINWLLAFWLGYQIIKAISVLIDYLFKRKIKNEDPATASALKTISTISKFVVWIIVLLFILSNLGIEITSVIAGLGIGGVAIAFALQNILSDLFSSFAIYFDKPFVVGDFIIVGDKMGVVEKIGLKTTRLRALQGEEITFSNQFLTSAQIQNFKKMAERRVVFKLDFTYNTPSEKLKQIPNIIKNIVDQQENARFDRAHFASFGSSALVYEIVYYVLSADYNEYMDIQQNLNLAIKLDLEKLAVDFAYPSQTIYLNQKLD